MGTCGSRKALLASLGAALCGCDALLSGAPADDATLDAPIEGLTPTQLRTFFRGDEAFNTLFGPADGLGPVFNAPSCASCHPFDGRGHPLFNLARFGRGDPNDPASFNYLEELGGPQLQDRAIPGYEPERLPPNVAVSVRGGPVVAGVGLLEAVPVETLIGLSDPTDGDGDGISGRVSFVLPPPFVPVPPTCDCVGCQATPEGCRLLARFGRKATAVSLLRQTVGAYHADMGITTDFMPVDVFNPVVGGPSGDGVADPEVPAATVHDVVFYLQTLAPPPRRDGGDAQVLAGERIFGEIGCPGCHVPALPTGASPIAPLAFVTAHAYTDLLLHDLGPDLADGFPEGDATGSEWRTTPLWGIGLVPTLLGGEEHYLHDGRARSLTEAIDLHGGEAKESADGFRGLSADARDALLAFLRSL
jgi:CxxC motif-containing protein (DUF1111 family)